MRTGAGRPVEAGVRSVVRHPTQTTSAVNPSNERDRNCFILWLCVSNCSEILLHSFMPGFEPVLDKINDICRAGRLAGVDRSELKPAVHAGILAVLKEEESRIYGGGDEALAIAGDDRHPWLDHCIRSRLEILHERNFTPRRRAFNTVELDGGTWPEDAWKLP